MRQEGAREDGVPVVEVVDAATMEDAAVEIARLAHEDDARGQAGECWAGLARDCAAGKALALVARRGTRIRGALALRSLPVQGQVVPIASRSARSPSAGTKEAPMWRPPCSRAWSRRRGDYRPAC
jgi:hypothetical protein